MANEDFRVVLVEDDVDTCEALSRLLQFDGYSDGVLGLTARDEFVRDWVKTHFLPAMLGDIEQAAGLAPEPGIRVDWRISSQLSSPPAMSRRAPDDR